jgi:(p)ppGpp synthase/HD superfamily hydrolase
VLEHGGDETAAIAALLHDVVEDGGGEQALAEIGARFGAEVAEIVKGCSDTTAAVKEDWTLRKERYIKHLESAPAGVLLVSAADKLHNARSVLSDLAEHGDELWARFNRGPHEQLWYYGSLRDIFKQRMPGPTVERARPDGPRHQPPGRPLYPPGVARPRLPGVAGPGARRQGG